MALDNIFNKFRPSKRKTKDNDILESQAITLVPVYRKRAMTEDQRKSYVTELLDTYYGFGTPYLAGYIKQSISNVSIQKEMLKIVRSLPLLQFFTDSMSRVYSVQPNRKFFLDGKEIIKLPVEVKNENSSEDTTEDTQNDDKPFNQLLNTDKFVHDDKLFDNLTNLYNDDIITGIKQAEKFTNLLHTTVYKLVTNDLGQIKMIFLPNDTVQVNIVNDDITRAEQIAFIQDTVNDLNNGNVLIPVIENWSKDFKTINVNKVTVDNLDKSQNEENLASIEYEKLFGTKEAGSAFAPFVVFRDTGAASDFWDQKDNDIVSYIKSINMSLTELKYLEKFTSFGLKYTVNIKEPEGGVMDPNGIISFAVANSAVPGVDSGKNFEVGEFTNSGSIDEVIKSIIFNMKMLFSIHHIPLDSLISSNSVRSAENKQMDNDELFAAINSQRDIWNNNEQVYFKVAQAIHNRDNDFKIPKGVTMLVDYEESTSKDKVADDWLIEIQNNISTAIDWIASINPDLDRNELMQLLRSNKEINDKQNKDSIDVNSFAQVDEQGNLIIPEDPNLTNDEDVSDNNSDVTN